MNYVSPPTVFASGQVTSVGAATEAAITVGSKALGVGSRIKLKEVVIQRVSGTAANYTPRVGISPGFTASDVNCMWAAGSTAVGTMTDDVTIDTCRSLADQTTTEYTLYILFGPDAGADNVFNYILVYEML